MSKSWWRPWSSNVCVTAKGSKGQVVAIANIFTASTPDPVSSNNQATRTVLIKGGLLGTNLAQQTERAGGGALSRPPVSRVALPPEANYTQ